MPWLVLTVVLTVVGCLKPANAPDYAALEKSAASEAGCRADGDCKGDRVCHDGDCVDETSARTGNAAGSQSLTSSDDVQLADLDKMRNERRVALVIGNGAYKMGALKNPSNDAAGMADVLKTVGFEVMHERDVNQKQLKRAIKLFGEKLRQGGVGLFFFAGHGMQVNGRNYLIPIGAEINDEADIDIESVRVGEVLAKMDAANNRLNVVILDACRNNPFARSFRSASRGLAFVEAPEGTLIAYATAPGSVAFDGAGEHGTFTGALIRHIERKGAKVESVFKATRADVRDATGGKQTPWESSSLIGDFYFALP